MQVFRGIAVSPGFVEGTAYVVEKDDSAVPKYWLHDREIKFDLKRFAGAVEKSKQQIERLKKKLSDMQGREHQLILDSHLAMLDDTMLKDDTRKVIENEKINAEWALTKTLRKILEKFSNIDEEYFRERRSDIAQVIDRVQKNLLGKSDEHFSKIDRPVVVVAHDLSPFDLAHMPKGHVIGIATDAGGRTSHTGIIAASMDIPAVLGTEEISRNVRTGDLMIVDGLRGLAIVNPSAETLQDYRRQRTNYLENQKSLIAEKDLPAETEDHRSIRLAANMEFVEEIPLILQQGAHGVGLFRTEFLFLNSDHLPTEDEQVKVYSEVLKAFAPNSVTIRTYDLGGDKNFPGLAGNDEPNPALGLRAIRFCLQQPEIFTTQLRALFRSSVNGDLRIMFPLISSTAELIEARKIANSVIASLKSDNIPVNSDVKIGIMVETPAAVLTADLLANYADFFSVGTNDLIQYTLAVDRVNEHVAYMYNPLHPAVLRMLKIISRISKKHKIPVNLCGEMASDPLFLPILVALGFSELSMNAVVIPRIKHLLRSLKFETCHKLLDHILKSKTAEESLYILKKTMHLRFPDYFDPPDLNHQDAETR